MEIKLAISDICTAFQEYNVIGTKAKEGFDLTLLHQPILEHDTAGDKVAGQHYIVLDESFHQYFSPGDGPKSDNPNDYTILVHREGPKMFLCRKGGVETKSLAMVVYTLTAYLNDPDITPQEAERVFGATHVIVAMLGSSVAEKSPVTPYRFVHNLAGGNHEYRVPDCLDKSPEEVINILRTHVEWLEGKARASLRYWNGLSVVGDFPKRPAR